MKKILEGKMRWRVNLTLLLFLGILFASSDAKDEQKSNKKKGDMTAYYKRTAAKFIAETAKKEGKQSLLRSKSVSMDLKI